MTTTTITSQEIEPTADWDGSPAAEGTNEEACQAAERQAREVPVTLDRRGLAPWEAEE